MAFSKSPSSSISSWHHATQHTLSSAGKNTVKIVLACTYWGAAFTKVLKPFQVYTAKCPIKADRALESNLLSFFTFLLLLSHALQFPGQLEPRKEWGSCKLLSERPREFSTSSGTTSTMAVPPPFLLLFGIKYVRVIHISVAKNLGMRTGLCGLWVQLQGWDVCIRKPWEMPALPFWSATFLCQSCTQFWLAHL